MTEHDDSTFNFSIEQNGSEMSLQAKIELLNVLNTAKAPLYLYDHIMACWGKLIKRNLIQEL